MRGRLTVRKICAVVIKRLDLLHAYAIAPRVGYIFSDMFGAISIRPLIARSK